MNIELLSTFQQNYPEEFDGILDCASLAVCCSFNKVGSLLAVGCSDGRLIIWDFLTRGIARIIAADWSPICCVSWSKKSDFIATSSTENAVCIWSTTTGRCLKRITCLQSPILKVQFHPRDSSVILICPMKHAPILVDQTGQYRFVKIDDEQTDVVSTFDRKGAHIILGNNRGLIFIKKYPELTTISSFRIINGANPNVSLKYIEVPRRGPYCLINTSDRIIRVYNYNEMLSCGIDAELDAKQKLQDLVNRSLWRKSCWSGDGEYICGAASRSHSLYIWETVSGKIVKILHGTKGESLADVCWHPIRPILVSISTGVVSIWSHSQVENWSAFAPDFRELEENVEYHERESEFDVHDEDRSVDGFDENGKKQRVRFDSNGQPIDDNEQSDVDVDVVDELRIEALVSSDDDDITDQLIYLPVAPEIENPDIDESRSPNMSRIRPPSPSLRTAVEADETLEINLNIPAVQDPHPYHTGTKQIRSLSNIHTNQIESTMNKRDAKERRKRPYSQTNSVSEPDLESMQTIILPKSIDAAVATVVSSTKRNLTTLSCDTKSQRNRSARLEGKKTNMTCSTSIISPTTINSTTQNDELSTDLKN